MTEVNYNTTTAKLATSKQLLSDLNADVATESKGKLGRGGREKRRERPKKRSNSTYYCRTVLSSSIEFTLYYLD